MSEESNKTIQNTLLGIAAVGAIGTGVYFMGGDGDIEEPPVNDVVEFVDDIEPIRVPIFTVDLPKLDMFNVDVPKVDVAKVETTKIESEKVEIFGVEIPGIENLSPNTIKIATSLIESIGIESLSPKLIKVLVTIVDTVDMGSYSIETVRIATNVIEGIGIESLSPEQIRILVSVIDTVDVNSYSVETIKIASQIIGGISIESLSPAQIRIIVAAIENLDGDIPKIQKFQKMVTGIFKDKRMVQHDKSFNIYNEAITEWLEIYSRPLEKAVEHKPLPRGIRMVAELRSLDFAKANLKFYKERGYNACLVPVDGESKIEDALALIKAVKDSGMDAWFAWSGPETLNTSLYLPPAKIASILKAVAPQCAGYLPAWRRTSAHLVMQDEQYIEYLAHQVRIANPNILIVGESYYGQTFENEPFINQRGWEARDNVIRNQSGILIAGISTQGFAVEMMLSRIFGRWSNELRLAMVLGEKPYYASRYNTGKSFLENLEIKKKIEDRFLRVGCVGTITIHGDGFDTGSSLMTIDDLGKFKIGF